MAGAGGRSLTKHARVHARTHARTHAHMSRSFPNEDARARTHARTQRGGGRESQDIEGASMVDFLCVVVLVHVVHGGVRSACTAR